MITYATPLKKEFDFTKSTHLEFIAEKNWKSCESLAPQKWLLHVMIYRLENVIRKGSAPPPPPLLILACLLVEVR